MSNGNSRNVQVSHRRQSLHVKASTWVAQFVPIWSAVIVASRTISWNTGYVTCTTIPMLVTNHGHLELQSAIRAMKSQPCQQAYYGKVLKSCC